MADTRTRDSVVPSCIVSRAFTNHTPSTEKRATRRKQLLLPRLCLLRHVCRLRVYTSGACVNTHVELRNCTGCKDVQPYCLHEGQR